MMKKHDLTKSRVIKIARLKEQNRILKLEHKDLENIIKDQDNALANILTLKEGTLQSHVQEIDLSKVLPSNINRSGIMISTLSDVHGDEIVDPKKVMGLNRYNPDIAKDRLQRYFFLLVKEAARLNKEVKIDSLHLGLLGDFISGNIHPELVQTNAMPPIHAMLFIQELLVKGIKYLSECGQFKHINVLCVTGNHPRITSKTYYKTRTGNSLEYFSYKVMEDLFSNVLTGYNNVEFEVAEGAFIRVQTPYNLSYTMSHGDHFNYLGGIGGIMIPATRWHLQFSKTVPADKRYIGNWHTWIPAPDLTFNGSVIGYNEFPMGKGLPFQQAIQHVELLDSMFGFTKKIPLILQD